MNLKIQRNKRVVATLTLTNLGAGDYEIEYLKVEPEYRKQGLASKLLQRAVKFATDGGFSLVAFVDPDGSGLSHAEITAWLKKNNFKPCKFDFAQSVHTLYNSRRGTNIKPALVFDGFAVKHPKPNESNR